MSETASVALRKRSIGVLFFALSIILVSVIRILGTGSIRAGFYFIAKPWLVVIITYSILSNIFYIISSVKALRLVSWARKSIIILTSIQLVYMIAVSVPLSNKSIQLMRTSPSAQEKIMAGYQAIPDYVIKDKNITEQAYQDLVFKNIHKSANIVRVISFFYLFLVLFFFTRPKVRIQFNQ